MVFKKIRIIHNDHDVPRSLIYRALARIDGSQNVAGNDIVDFGRVVGYSNLVKVDNNDEFYEEVRGNRPYASRFVKNKLPIACSKLAIVWRRQSEDEILVITAYFTTSDNPYCPDEPGNIIRKINQGESFSPKQLQESLDFWSTHAFVEPIPLDYHFTPKYYRKYK